MSPSTYDMVLSVTAGLAVFSAIMVVVSVVFHKRMIRRLRRLEAALRGAEMRMRTADAVRETENAIEVTRRAVSKKYRNFDTDRLEVKVSELQASLNRLKDCERRLAETSTSASVEDYDSILGIDEHAIGLAKATVQEVDDELERLAKKKNRIVRFFSESAASFG